MHKLSITSTTAAAQAAAGTVDSEKSSLDKNENLFILAPKNGQFLAAPDACTPVGCFNNRLKHLNLK